MSARRRCCGYRSNTCAGVAAVPAAAADGADAEADADAEAEAEVDADDVDAGAFEAFGPAGTISSASRTFSITRSMTCTPIWW